MLDKAEISDDIDFLVGYSIGLDQNIGWLDISMHIAPCIQMHIALIKLIKNSKRLYLRKPLTFLQHFAQIPLIIQLCNNVAVISRHKRIHIPIKPINKKKYLSTLR
jgi:hypothetical protein